ncbi:MAG TPA: SDR family oxidoreductase [Chloroflexota bacterium]|nr:SDR family oxidoreductase [Chloroflexota bacterium]
MRDRGREAASTLSGEIALISGGASGIGRAIAERFAREGAAVVILDLAAEGSDVAESIVTRGGRAVFALGDACNAADCRRAVTMAQVELGPITILVNNAGIIRRTSVLETSEEDWDRVMAVNVKSAFLLSKAVLPGMIERGGGVIINMGSGWGLVGGRDAAAYCASKGAIVQLTRAMALDHGPSGVRVNCLCPGDTATGMLMKEAEQLGESPERFLAEAAERPLGRIGRPEDIADAALFLAGDAARFVTGTTLVVDGGGLAG